MRKIRELYGDEIDFYGKGICSVDDKAKALASYEFSICIETRMNMIIGQKNSRCYFGIYGTYLLWLQEH